MNAPLYLWSAVAGLLAAAGLIEVADLAPLLRYSREGIAAGELWRPVTAHLVHLGPAHLALNAIGTVLVAALVGHHLRSLAWAATWLACAVTVAAGLWWWTPWVEWYVGLSGVLHGLLVTGAVAALAEPRERLFAGVVVVAVIAKLAWEATAGATPGTAMLAGGRVVTESHLFGALGGALAGALALASHRRARSPDAPG